MPSEKAVIPRRSRRGRPPVASPLVAAVCRLRPADRDRIDAIARAFGWSGSEALRECVRRGAAELLTGNAPPGGSLLVLTPAGHTELRVTLTAEQSELSANLEALISNAAAAARARRAGARLTERHESRADVIPIDFEAIESNA